MSRSRSRNVNFFDGSTGDHLGGVRQNGSITNINFFHMLMDTLLIVESTITIKSRTTGQPILLDTEPLEVGDYDIFCPQGTIKLTGDVCVRRIISHRESARENSFRDGVRARDGRCVLTGVVNHGASLDDWTGFEAAHIFPMEKETLWNQHNFSRWITNTTGCHSAAINSVQNGILISGTIHSAFDNYLVSVNPDDGYKITYFGIDNWSIDGRVLDPACRDPNDPHRVANKLLRWHFRQSVLANMKETGEPIFEHDFPPARI
ncbi:hypothetical protein N7535_003518 [Penicillium sp. DV-2018c]|nr:hypothetical protein N7535_003518 [Penicillium sp. DV-2018c]